MKLRSNLLRNKAFERDGFVCQKCKIQDKTAKLLEAHHIWPIYLGGEDKLENLITLCKDCHHFAPNNKEKLGAYLEEEMTGTATTLINAITLARKEHPELFEQINKN